LLIFKKIKSIETPALYLFSQEDTLINYKHSLKLIENHGIRCTRRVVESLAFKGDHNDIRNEKYI